MDQQFSLSWNNFHGNLTKGFAGLLGKAEFVDVTIAVEGHLLQAHKVILSICSPYFKKMFQLNPCQHPIVVLRDVSHKSMGDLLQFMYHGEVSVKREDLTSFIRTAELLQIKGLTNKETDEESIEKEQEHNTHKHSLDSQNHTPDAESCISETFDSSANEDIPTNELEIMKQLQRLSSLKRKSEEFLQKNYYADMVSIDKRAKLKDKLTYTKHNNNMLHSNNYESLKSIYDDPLDASLPFKPIPLHSNSSKESIETAKDLPNESALDLKTECDEMDIIVTDPAVCSPSKNFDGSQDGKKDNALPLDYHSPQDNCTSINSLFMDLKNLVNGKVTNMMRPGNEEFTRPIMEHRLVTIPQKEDGKKKYPQRSCRLCWKIGKRRDTRFMCSACELPFCKTPCFEVHYHDILKYSQSHGDYYAA